MMKIIWLILSRDLFGDHGLLRFDIVAPSQKPYMPFEKDSAMECRRNVSSDITNPSTLTFRYPWTTPSVVFWQVMVEQTNR